MKKYVMYVHELDTLTGIQCDEPVYRKDLHAEDFVAILLGEIPKPVFALPEPKPVDHVTNGKRGGRKPGTVYNCSLCGKPGHTVKTCIKNVHKTVSVVVEEPKPKEPQEPKGDTRSNRARVKELWEGGLDMEEVIESLPDIDMIEIRAIFSDLERKRND